VISYEDLEETRVKRAEKDMAKKASKEKRDQKRKTTALEAEANGLDTAADPTVFKCKEKRGRKRKGTALEADAPDVEAGPAVHKDKVARTSEVVTAENTEVSSWRAPSAKMY
jgi:hypothetical protein